MVAVGLAPRVNRLPLGLVSHDIPWGQVATPRPQRTPLDEAASERRIASADQESGGTDQWGAN